MKPLLSVPIKRITPPSAFLMTLNEGSALAERVIPFEPPRARFDDYGIPYTPKTVVFA